MRFVNDDPKIRLIGDLITVNLQLMRDMCSDDRLWKLNCETYSLLMDLSHAKNSKS